MDYIWRMCLAIFLLCAGMVCGLVIFLAQKTILAGILAYVMLFAILGGIGLGILNIIDYYQNKKHNSDETGENTPG